MITGEYLSELFSQGIVRPSGGHAVALNWSMKHIYGVKPGEVRCHLMYGTHEKGNVFVHFYESTLV